MPVQMPTSDHRDSRAEPCANGFPQNLVLLAMTLCLLFGLAAWPLRAENLEDAWASALTADHRLEASRFAAAAAEEQWFGEKAYRLPLVTAETGYTLRDSESAFTFSYPAAGLVNVRSPYRQRENFDFQAIARLPIYTSGLLTHRIEAAAARHSAAQVDVEQARLDTKMNVAAAYVAVLRAQRALDVAVSNLENIAAHEHDVSKLFERQRVPRNDLLAAQVARSNARHHVIRSQNDLDTARAAYNRQQGRRLSDPVQLDELPEVEIRQNVGDLTRRAIGQRPDLSAMASRVRAYEHQGSAAQAVSRPQIELQGGYAFEENRYQEPQGIASVGLALRWDLYDSGRSRHQAQALWQQAQRLKRLLLEQESIVALQIRQAWLDTQETEQRVEVTRRSIQRADENLRVARRRYAMGRATNTEVLGAERLRAEIYRNYYFALYDSMLAVLRLDYAVGTL